MDRMNEMMGAHRPEFKPLIDTVLGHESPGTLLHASCDSPRCHTPEKKRPPRDHSPLLRREPIQPGQAGTLLPSDNRSAAKGLDIADVFAGLRVTAERLRLEKYR